MNPQLQDITFVIIAGTLLFVFLIFFIVVFFVIYQKRRNQVEFERRIEQEKYQLEIQKVRSEIREETLKFISRELHDNIAQSLLISKLSLNKVTESSELGLAKSSLNHTIDQVRLLSKSLDSDSMFEGGLLQSLAFEVDRLTQLNRWNIDYFNDVKSIELSKENQLILFRVFQELINNMIKHSQAKNVCIEFDKNETNYILTITDDGNQYDFQALINENSFGSGAGLKNIVKRVEIINGDLIIAKNKSEGMTTIVKI